MLYGAGVPVLAALEVCEGAAGNLWIAQGIAILITILFSYLGHARFTFRPLGSKPPEG